MEKSFGLVFILLTILLTHSNAFHGQNSTKTCRVFSPDELNVYNKCGEQFVAHGLAHNSNRNASIVKKAEFPW